MSSSPKDTRAIAILAHVDAGKTTVSERLLYFSETIPGLGEVDEGLATMDYLEEEKKRGITIEAGIASYQWKGTRVTFVDTPGHVDFGVEVDFALQAVEGVILVLSGVSGIESQSLEAWGKIKANHNSTLIFINKLDIPGSDYRRVMEQVQVMFNVKPVALTLPVYIAGADGGQPALDGVIDVLNQLALYRSVDNPRKLIKGDVPTFLADDYARARKDLVDVASQFNDVLLNAWMAGEELKNEEIVAGLKAAMDNGGYIPVYMGSALKNVGIRQLMNGVNLLLPAPGVRRSGGSGDPCAGPPKRSATGVLWDREESMDRSAMGFIIKIRHYQDIGKIFLAKIYDPSSLGNLDSARFFRVFAESLVAIKDITEIKAGDVVAIQSNQNYRMGQVILPDGKPDTGPNAGFMTRKYRPLLQSRIELVCAEDFEYVDRILKQLADTEPSISITPDHATGGWLISTVGELQLDVFCKRLKKDHKCDIKIGAPSVRFLERLKGPQRGLANTSVASFRGHAGGSLPLMGSSLGAEVRIGMDILGSTEDEKNRVAYAIPVAPEYKEVIEATFEHFCSQGICGIGDVAGLTCRITEIAGSKNPDKDLERQIPLPLLAKCFADGLKLNLSCAQFEVFEPVMRLEIIIPDEFCGLVLADLASRGGIVRKLDSDGYNSIILIEIPLSSTFGYTTLLRSLTRGLGVYVLTYEKHGVRR
ncbi:MAG: GTP-binding protein [Fibrobacterota bacterium]|nr:GTP-binding protein [Fibrobacterota bacterium]